jgi:hypothetical protein
MIRQLSLGLFLLLLIATPIFAQETDDLSRVRAMTREERARMSKKLDTFDSLSRAERDRIRAVNDRLAELDPVARSHSLSVLRSYHVLYRNLSEEKRKILDAETNATKKLDLIASFRAELPAPARLNTEAIQVSALSPLRLRGLARDLIVYFGLDPVNDAKERSEFAKLKSQADRQVYVRNLRLAKGIRDRPELREKLREEDEEFRAAEEAVMKNPALAKRLKQGEQEAAKSDAQPKRAETAKGKEIPAKPRNMLINLLDEQQVLRDHVRDPVEAAKLEMFEDALPSWARDSLDNLPPDAARRRLKTLYRLVFPAPEEMQPQKAPPPTAKPKAATKPEGAPETPF